MKMTIDNSKMLVLTLCSALLLVGCNKAKQEAIIPTLEPSVSGSSVRFPAASTTPKRVITTPVVAAKGNTITLPGRIVWDEDHTSHIVPPVSGRVVDIPTTATLGAVVQANLPLANLLSPEVGTAQAESASAKFNFLQAEKNFTRINDLIADKGAAIKDLELAKTELSRAQAESVRAALRLKTLGVNGSEVDQRFTVRSPIAGVVVERNINPAMEWRADQTNAMFTITDPSYLWCQIDAPEQFLSQLHTDMEVELHSNAWPQESFTAVIDNIGDSIDAASRTVKVRAHLRNSNRHLKNAMYVTATLVGEPMGSLAVPTKAVFLNNKNEHQVFVKTGEGEFTRKTIVPVTTNDQWVAIETGLNNHDEIVVDGALYLEKILDGVALQPASDKPNL